MGFNSMGYVVLGISLKRKMVIQRYPEVRY